MSINSHIRTFLLVGLLLATAAGLISEGHAQARRGWGGGGYSAPVYRQTAPAPMAPVMRPTLPAPRPMPGPTTSGPRMPGGATGPVGGPRPAGALGGGRALPPRMAAAPIAHVPSYTGRVTVKGAPIVTTKTGATYAIPEKGVFSTKIVQRFQSMRTTLTRHYADGRVAVLQTRIATYAKDVKLITKAGSGDNKPTIKEKFNSASTGWGLEETLSQHFRDHGKEVGAKTKFEYAKMANDFYVNRRNYAVKVDSDGVTRVYNQKTGEFGAYNADGTTKSFYKIGKNQEANDRYWAKQKGN